MIAPRYRALRIADLRRLRHARLDVAPVDAGPAEPGDPLLQAGVADRRRAHVDAAAPGAEIEPGADQRDRPYPRTHAAAKANLAGRAARGGDGGAGRG